MYIYKLYLFVYYKYRDILYDIYIYNIYKLDWCKIQPHVTSTIIGATNIKQLQENLNCFINIQNTNTNTNTNIIGIPEEAIEDINNIYKKYRDPSRI